MKQWLGLVTAILGAAFLLPTACDSGSKSTSGGGAGPDSSVGAGEVAVSLATPRARTTTWSVNYWNWMPTYGDDVSGTEAPIAALKPGVMRIGGYNNDANTADAFGNAQLDRAVLYARAIGAEPVIQVPLLADIDGTPPTADTAAAMVTYANVTQSYGVKYFSIGNEPDLYDTQGSLTDATKPAIPNYQPADYCASARAYVAAMKAVDPTIQIVGPDLSWHYTAGADWLTPILQGCGDLFDIVSIHRYPFSSKQATLENAQADAMTFANVLVSVRVLMNSAGYGDKPLALMEMNSVYEATACQVTASPATIGSALWLADGLGTAIERDLWTSAVWDIADGPPYALGLIGPAPTHTLRPAYYAYRLFADHFGPTLVDVTKTPTGVRAYASRNTADDTTALVVINWSTSSAPFTLRVTGGKNAPAPVTYTVPALSISALEIPDDGAPVAFTYDDAQHQAGAGIIALDPDATGGATGATDGGPPALDHACSSTPATICPKLTLPNAAITTMAAGDGADLTYGSLPYQWDIYTYAANGQTAPTAVATADGNGIQISGSLVPPVTANWAGVGLDFDNTSCIDASKYTGVQFDFSGTLGACTLAIGSNFSADQYSEEDPGRGSCAGGDSVCYPPVSVVTPAGADAGDIGPTTIKAPFTAFAGGSPNAKLDASTLLTVQWQLNARSGGPGCTAHFTVSNVAFY